MQAFGWFGAGALSAVSTGLCVQSYCFWSLCSWDKEDTLLFGPEASSKREVNVAFFLFSPCLSVACLGRIMAVAKEELHANLKRIRGECTRVKKKLEESFDRGERLKVVAVEREKVLILFAVRLTMLLL